MRIPGEGTARLINRGQEAEVYRTIKGRGFCDDLIYMNPENGYKITRYLQGVRTSPGDKHYKYKCKVWAPVLPLRAPDYRRHRGINYVLKA